MQNLFKNTEFMMGVTQYKNLPEDTGTEILLAGRSNAGKSSALNALTENKKRDQFVTAGLGYSSINQKNNSQFLINAFGTQNTSNDMNSSLISFTYNKKF